MHGYVLCEMIGKWLCKPLGKPLGHLIDDWLGELLGKLFGIVGSTCGHDNLPPSRCTQRALTLAYLPSIVPWMGF